MLDLAPLRPKLTIWTALFVGQELFLANAVITFLFVLLYLALVLKALQHSLHAMFVQRFGCRRPTVILH